MPYLRLQRVRVAEKHSMGRDFDRAVKLFKELEEERNDFKLEIEP